MDTGCRNGQEYHGNLRMERNGVHREVYGKEFWRKPKPTKFPSEMEGGDLNFKFKFKRKIWT